MKTYYMRFGDGDPRNYCGLAPTFVIFKLSDNTNVTPPSISQVGTSTGIYYFNWGTTTPITFLADAATTSPGAAGRYVAGSVDPNDRGDEYSTTLTAIGTTILSYVTGLSGFATSAIGSTASSYGTDTADPVDLFGYLKRIIELYEGNESFEKSTNVLSMLSRGSSTLLREKTITNSASGVTKV